MNQLISVIVPVYNVEGYISKCLDSLLEQTYTNLEIILVDDGSTDKSSEICKKYANIDNRVRLIYQENGGLSKARNTALDVANGEYISFVDSDDWVDKNMLSEMYTSLILNQADIVVAGHYIVNIDGSIMPTISVKEIINYNRIEATSLILEDFIIHSFAWDKLYRKELFDGVRYPVGRIYEDTATTYKLFDKSNKVIQLNKAYYYYVRRETSICLELGIVKDFKRKYDNYLAFYERYIFTNNNSQYKHLIDLCQEKAFLHGRQFLHFCIKYSFTENGLFAKTIEELSLLDLTNNHRLKAKFKFEQILLKISKSFYVSTLHQLKKFSK